MDKYIGTSNFADQFYDYNVPNKKFIDKVKLYKIECEYNNLNKELSNILFESNKLINFSIFNADKIIFKIRKSIHMIFHMLLMFSF